MLLKRFSPGGLGFGLSWAHMSKLSLPVWPEPAEFWPPDPGLQRHEVGLDFEGAQYTGCLVAPPAAAGPKPLVLVCPNYCGLKWFDVRVCEYLARVGYVGLAVDVNGALIPPEKRVKPEGDPATDPAVKEHFELAFAAMVSLDHDAGKLRRILDAWRVKGLEQPCVEKGCRPAAIGYCFGGICVIEMVRGGLDFSAVVSFHGLLQTGEDPNAAHFGITRPPIVPCANNYSKKTVLIIENGTWDHLVPAESISRFHEEMLPAGVDLVFENHAEAPHGFALAPRIGHHHERSDRRSTQSMLSILREVFPHVQQQLVEKNACGTTIPHSSGPAKGAAL